MGWMGWRYGRMRIYGYMGYGIYIIRDMQECIKKNIFGS